MLKWNIHLAFDEGAVGALEREHEDGDDYERDFVHVWSAGVDDCLIAATVVTWYNEVGLNAGKH